MGLIEQAEKERQEELANLRALCARATDALEWCKKHHREITPKGNERNELIAELRKAKT